MEIRLKQNEELCDVCAYGPKVLKSCERRLYWKSFNVGNIRGCEGFSFVFANKIIKKRLNSKTRNK